jgi:hypothetical protein
MALCVQANSGALDIHAPNLINKGNKLVADQRDRINLIAREAESSASADTTDSD